jgi:hypothetical protein
MKSKILTACLSTALIFAVLPTVVPIQSAYCEHTVGEVDDLIGGIVDYKLNQTGSGSVEDWLTGDIAAGAGTSTDWYALTLSQSGYSDLSAYRSSLESYLSSNNVSSATSREKYALGLCASGSTSSYITDTLESSIGRQGIMSWVYGLHILNNGYTCPSYTAESVADYILSLQLGDGGWALWGDYGDIDVTAMTLQALAPQYDSSDAVSEAVDRAVDFLAERQKEDGGYESFGNPNAESTAQVLTAVSALGIDCRYDDRFIKEGNDLIDGIAQYRLPDGSFCHTKDGGFNETATVQAYYSFVAFRRMTEGKSPLLILDNKQTAQPSQGGCNEGSGSKVSSQEGGSSANEGISAGTTAPAADKTTTAANTGKSTGTTTTGTGTAAAKETATVTSLSVTSGASQTVTAVTAAQELTEKQSRRSYKPFAIIIVLAAAAIIALIIFIMGKRSYKNFIFLGAAAAAAIAVILLTDIRSPEEYYSGEKREKDNVIGSVTMEIRCDTIAGKSDSEHIPADGVILAPTAFDIESGDTVFDILTEAAQTYGIQVENKGSAGSSHGMVYISGINYIYEFDFGDLSGWVYHVNGITPSRNCGEYVLSDGDRIEWLYTCEVGHDLNEVYEE